MPYNKRFSYSPFFWLGLIVIFFGGIGITLKYFTTAFPIVNIDLKMDREQALSATRNICDQQSIGPNDPHSVASFSTDLLAKYYIELEGGGIQTFKNMLTEKLYEPYTWKVRHYKAHETNEATIIFAPDGTPYGFTEKIAEQAKGPNISQDQALHIAQETAEKSWNVDFAPYVLIESSVEIRPNGRGDHTFIFERSDLTLNEGRYRIKIVVSGDKVTELTRLIKTPDEFLLRYKEMRSANNGIAFAGWLLMALLYVIGGCIGLYFVFRANLGQWKPAIFAGFIIALLDMFSRFNSLPLIWTSYDTAVAPQQFLILQIILILIQSLMFIFFYGLVFAAAENLTRIAFGYQPQLWTVWKKQNASSYEILGRTVGGYLSIGFDFGYIVLTYIFATKYLGWWSPTDTLIEPNVLGTYLPWLNPLVLALTAGFLEECLCRAIPLAGAALLGQRFGKQKIWIAAAFIVQAVIFGALHANYPTQPATARLIELIIPSFIFGWIYLRWGLLPAIISHFTFDIVWMALPLFISHAPRAWINQLITILLALIPLWIVIFARLRERAWKHLPTTAYNEAWLPTTQATTVQETEPTPHTPVQLTNARLHFITIMGIIGLCFWLYYTPFKQDAPKMTINSHEAIKIAEQALFHKYSQATNEFFKSSEPLITLQSDYHTPQQNYYQHKFIWNINKELYHNYLSTYLNPPLWFIRFVQFDGTVAERSREYQVFVDPQGTIRRMTYKMAEADEGPHLSLEDARKKAHQELNSHYALDPVAIEEISATPTKKPHRTNWSFVFAVDKSDTLQGGQARITITINGDQVVDSYQSIHVPEEWQRAEQGKQTTVQIINLIAALLLVLIFLFGLMSKTFKHFSMPSFLYIAGITFLVQLLMAYNNWPMKYATFNTSEPYTTQFLVNLGSIFLSSLFMAGAFGFLLSLISKKLHSKDSKSWTSLLTAPFIAGIILGLYAYGAHTNHALEPYWSSAASYGTRFPFLGFLLQNLITGITTLCFAVVILGCTHYFNKKGNWLITLLCCLSGGLIFTGLQHSFNYSSALISTACITLLLFMTIQFIETHLFILPTIIGISLAGHLIQFALCNPYYGSSIHAAVTAFILCIIITFFNRSK